MNDSHSFAPPTGTLVFHASAIKLYQGALVFLGPSGIGKSTICRLLSSVSEKWADDVVHLTLNEAKQWDVIKSPNYKGLLSEPSLKERDRIPLNAIVRLSKSRTPLVQSISPSSSCCYLMQAIFDIKALLNCSCEFRMKLFAQAASVVRSTPGYLFHFDLSQQSIDLILNVFDKERRL
jgi:energy-coupling factor transporter ATP-binding protein EcfA2